MSVTRDELHRLVDDVPSEELEQASEYLRHLVDRRTRAVKPRRQFRSMGAFSGPPDLAERAKDILREELGGSK